MTLNKWIGIIGFWRLHADQVKRDIKHQVWESITGGNEVVIGRRLVWIL